MSFSFTLEVEETDWDERGDVAFLVVVREEAERKARGCLF